MPLLSILAMILAIQAIPWPEPVVGGAGTAVSLTLGTHGLLVALAWFACHRLAAALRRPNANRRRILQRYVRIRHSLAILNLLALGLSLGALGWGWAIWTHGPTVTVGEEHVLLPFAELIIILPTVLTTILSWLGHHAVESAIRETMVNPPTTPFYSRFGFALFQFRMYAMLVLLPSVLTATQLSFSRVFPTYTDHPLVTAAGIGVSIAAIVIFPLAVPFLLGLVPMHAGPMRDRLVRLAQRCGFRLREWLVWPTRGSMANALVVGVIARARFVIFSDKLLDLLTPDELDAVCGHEIGHVRHGHILYYAVFLALSGGFVITGTIVGMQWLMTEGILSAAAFHLLELTLPIVLLGVYLYFVFGFVSRGCERQADIFGCKAVSCGNPTCAGHYGFDHETILPETVTTVCPTGIRTFVNALDAVVGGDVNEQRSWKERLFETLRAWQHGPAVDRIRYLERLIDRPELERSFQRRFYLTKWLIIIGLAIGSVALGLMVK